MFKGCHIMNKEKWIICFIGDLLLFSCSLKQFSAAETKRLNISSKFDSSNKNRTGRMLYQFNSFVYYILLTIIKIFVLGRFWLQFNICKKEFNYTSYDLHLVSSNTTSSISPQWHATIFLSSYDINVCWEGLDS